MLSIGIVNAIVARSYIAHDGQLRDTVTATVAEVLYTPQEEGKLESISKSKTNRERRLFRVQGR